MKKTNKEIDVTRPVYSVETGEQGEIGWASGRGTIRVRFLDSVYGWGWWQEYSLKTGKEYGGNRYIQNRDYPTLRSIGLVN